MRRPAPLAAFLLLLAGPATAANLCDELARTIRQGKLSDFKAGNSLMGRLAKAEPGLVTLNEERFERSVPKPFHMPTEVDSVSYQPFGDSGVVAIMSMAGSMHCESFEFYRRKGDRAVNFPRPPGVLFSEGGDLCWDSYAHIGAVHSIPTLFIEDDADHAQSLTLFPLRDHKWMPRCRINVEFAPTLRIGNAYCNSGTCPATLSGKAVQIAQNYNGKSGQPDRITGPQATALLALSAKAKDQLTVLPHFGISSSNPYTEFSKTQAFALLLDGKPSLAVVGGGQFGWREYRGILVAFWKAAGNELVPLAGFQIEKANQTIKNVSVTTR